MPAALFALDCQYIRQVRGLSENITEKENVGKKSSFPAIFEKTGVREKDTGSAGYGLFSVLDRGLRHTWAPGWQPQNV